MAFTIEVEKKAKNEDFQTKDLSLFHQECGGGRLSIHADHYAWRLKCKRCQMTIRIKTSERGSAALAKIAIDGKRREIHACVGSGQVFAVQRSPD